MGIQTIQKMLQQKKKKKKLPLTKEELKSHHHPKACHICGKRILEKFANDKSY